MTTIAFFGHDAADAAVRRRVKSFEGDGLDVVGFMMRRRETTPEWQNIDLGQTRDGAFLHRIRQIFSGARIAANNADRLRQADVIYARNLDMLACAFLAKRYSNLDTPVIYESLDVHRLLTRKDLIGRAMRWLERSLLKRSRALVVSSPGFLKNHFHRHYGVSSREFLIENRLGTNSDFGVRPTSEDIGIIAQPDKLTLGWVGILRCRRSFELLCALADQFPDQLDVRLHGIPARTEITGFEDAVNARANMQYFGKFSSPEDLSAIYQPLDLVWAGDFMEAGYNSVWLLPNRIYEGGYYATPSVAPAGTETAAWLRQHACGFVVEEPLEQSLPALVRSLISDRGPIVAYAQQLAKLPDDIFVQPAGFLRAMIDDSLEAEVAA